MWTISRRTRSSKSHIAAFVGPEFGQFESTARWPTMVMMFQDLHVIDFHAHFPVHGDVSTARGGPRQYTAGSPAAEQAEYMRAQAERYRAAWRLAWDFPQPDPEPEAG